ncbi:CRISPR-associated endonuclease Cas3'' [Stygiolobus caldivivus]|uniref:CRISPR-associated endonuclease Cas3 n=1 Tax=Stygiolobus caldivivus TaxID=2824673 RepID=A0A8D5U5N3_9CREN|nr:CRISPR-associated endonuclease Cas3'' [Stygiolobus caldivivus]BCU69768.1 CRISPR-associated endonuclease Cas3'' [Stygiolobus caldivivus]
MTKPCAYFEGGECKESYLTHIRYMLDVWERIKGYYVKTLDRVAGKGSEHYLKLAFLAHDAGKLLKAYTRDKRKFRHELVGAYVLYKMVGGGAGDVFATAVLLHHESIILSVYAGQYGERIIPLSTVRAVLEDFKGLLTPYASLKDDEAYGKVGMEKEIDEMEGILSSLKADDVYDVVKSLVVGASSGKDSLVFRNKVSAVLHVLVLVDSVAANTSRADSRDEGTWVTKAAKVAEPGVW